MRNLSFKLQAKQYELNEYLEKKDRAKYIMYGGSKGGGKSFASRALAVKTCMVYSGIQGVIIRKTFPELNSLHIRSLFLEYPFMKEWWRASEKAFYFPNKSVLEMRHLATTNDVYNYQGIEYQFMILDEATQHDHEVFRILKTSMRSSPEFVANNPDFRNFFLLTANPGGIGHSWVKRLFVDRKFDPNEKADDYHFIPAKLWDNRLFLDANPWYLDNLNELGSDLRKAYLDGDWNVFIGQFFGDWREDIHIVEPFDIPEEWNRVFCVDWGYSPHPSHVGWYAINPENHYIYKYRELEVYETPPVDLAKMIVEKSKEEVLTFGVGDTQMWAQNPFQTKSELGYKQEVYTDKSIALMMNDVFLKHFKIQMFQANKDRMTGWVTVKSALKWEGTVTKEGREFKKEPSYYIFKTCESTIRAYPDQIHNELRPGDMVKKDGDDPCDTDRYALMAITEKKPQSVVNYLEREKEEVGFVGKLKRLYKNSGLVFDEVPFEKKKVRSLY